MTIYREEIEPVCHDCGNVAVEKDGQRCEECEDRARANAWETDDRPWGREDYARVYGVPAWGPL